MDEDICFDVGTLWGEQRVNKGDPSHAFVYNVPKDRLSTRAITAEEQKKLKGTDLLLSSNVTTIEVTLAESSSELMAQFVWQSSITLADRIALGAICLEGKHVIELGAGAGLPGIVAALSKTPSHVTVTDYPDDAIVENILRNVARVGATCSVKGYSLGKGYIRDIKMY